MRLVTSSPHPLRPSRSFLSKLDAAEQRDNEKLQARANALFRRTLPPLQMQEQSARTAPRASARLVMARASARAPRKLAWNATPNHQPTEPPRSPMIHQAKSIAKAGLRSARVPLRRVAAGVLTPGRRGRQSQRDFGKAALAAKSNARRGGKRGAKAKPSSTSTDPARDCVQHGFHPIGPISAGAFSMIRHAKAKNHPRLPHGFEVAIKVRSHMHTKNRAQHPLCHSLPTRARTSDCPRCVRPREQSWSASSCAKDSYNADARDMELLALRRAGFHGPHANVANLIQIVAGPAATHAVLEYCGGGSLQRHLTKLQKSKGAAATRRGGARTAPHGAMPEAEACSVIVQVAAGLAHLHGLDIAHRDIKPANVLFQTAARTSIKLCDFGFAVICGDGEGGQRRLTMRCGTPVYMAPELVAGHQYLGPPVDMWALGAMCYEMLQGKPAFHGSSVDAVEQRIRSLSYSPITIDSPDAKAFVDSCLVTPPSQRLSALRALRQPWILSLHSSSSDEQPTGQDDDDGSEAEVRSAHSAP